MPLTEEMVAEVKESIDKLGDSTKQNYEELNKSHEQLKGIVEKQGNLDPISKEHFDKWAADTVVRQEKLDKATDEAVRKANERMDAIEVSMKRIRPAGSIEEDRELIKQSLEFQVACAAGKGQTWNWRQKRDMESNVVGLKEYTDAFNEFCHVDEKMLSADSVKAMQVGIDVDGGYTVTPAMLTQIVERLFEIDPIRSLTQIQTITTDAVEMYEDVDEADADWEGETVANEESSTAKLKKKRIPVHILSARPRATQMLLDDSSINIETWIANKVAEKMGRTEAASFVTGDGVGKPRGFGTYPAWTTAGTYEHGKIEQVNMGHATKFTTDGLIDVKYSMIEQHLTIGTWLTNRLNVSDIMKLKDGDGQYIWRPGITEGQPAILLGLPFRMSTTVATAGASALAIYLADWKQAYMIVDRQGINVLRDPYTVKPFIEFYTRKRVGGDVVNYQAIKIGKISE